MLEFANKILKDQPSLVCSWLWFFNVVFYNTAFVTFTVECSFYMKQCFHIAWLQVFKQLSLVARLPRISLSEEKEEASPRKQFRTGAYCRYSKLLMRVSFSSLALAPKKEAIKLLSIYFITPLRPEWHQDVFCKLRINLKMSDHKPSEESGSLSTGTYRHWNI